MARASTGGMYLWKHARGLNVWRVTSEGVKNNGHQEKQNEVIARSILLSSLDDDIFSHVFSCTSTHDLWKDIKENHEGTKDVSNEKYQVLFGEFSQLKQLDHENTHSWYSRLNVLVNEMNALDVKKLEDGDIIRKIIGGLHKPDYDIISSILLS